MTLSQSVNAAALAVKVEGIDGALLQNVMAFLGIAKEMNQPDLFPSRIQHLHTQAPEQIRQALQPFGYYRAKIDSKLVTTDDGWEAFYKVDAGPPLLIAELDLQISGDAKNDPRFQESVEDFPLNTGQVFVHSQYETAKQSLQRLAVERGYHDTTFTRHQVRIDLQAYSAAVTLHLDSGRRYAFGDLLFTQEPNLFDEDYLAHYATFEQGDPYQSTALLALRNGLTDSGHFAAVEVRPLFEQAVNYQVPVEVVLTPAPPARYKFGLGFGTDSGPRASMGYSRQVKRRGHKAGMNIRLSPRLSSGTVDYSIPLTNPSTERLTFASGLTDEDTQSRDSRTFELSTLHTTRRGEWLETKRLSYENEDFSVGGTSDNTTLIFPGIGWNRTITDDPLFPTHGQRLRFDILGSANALGSDVSFLQSRLDAKWVQSFAEKNRVILRGNLGATLVDSVEQLPGSKRFFAGGDQSIRGYDFEELGPTDATGSVVGGKHLAVGSVEYERRLFGKWSSAVFYDAGNAFDSFNSFDERLNHGAGIGIRWQSPVGPLRIDLAWALSNPGNPIRLHFVLGPDL